MNSFSSSVLRLARTKPLSQINHIQLQYTSTMETVRNTIAENFGGPAQTLASKENQFTLEEVPDLSGKVAVVTGGSRGIGFACSHTLLKNNVSKLFIVSRMKDAFDEALKQISTDLGADKAKKVTWLECEIGDWKAVVETTKKISEATDRIDILINDAARGIMTYELTDYGVDRHMAVNHFGHVIFTSHLLPVLKKTAEKGNTVRIVALGSNAHQGTPSDCKFESLSELNTDLGPNGQYGRSKLAQMLYCKYLNKHLRARCPKILANSVHPGFVETRQSVKDIHEPYPILGYAMSLGMKPFKKDQFQGCVSAMFCATKTEKSGQYVCPPAIPEEGNALYQQEGLDEQLMELTKQVVKDKMYAESVGKGCLMELY